MIITESFVWINNPQTASTFVRETLRQLYTISPADSEEKRKRFQSRWIKEILCPERRPGAGKRTGQPTPHGTVSQIPIQCRHLPVASAIRDSVSRYLSLYNYRDWQKLDQLPAPIEVVLEHFPNFPNLGFEEFVEYSPKFYGTADLMVGDVCFRAGPLSMDFLRFFTVPQESNTAIISFKSWEDLISQIQKTKFLSTANVNKSLHDFLLEFGFHKDDLAFILNKPPSNVSEKKVQSIQLDTKMVQDTEWLLEGVVTHQPFELMEYLVSVSGKYRISD